MRLFHIFCYILQSLAERSARSAIKNEEHAERALVSVVYRQYRQSFVRRKYVSYTARIHDICRDIALAQHNALRFSGRSGREQKHAHPVRIDILRSELGISECHKALACSCKLLPVIIIRICSCANAFCILPRARRALSGIRLHCRKVFDHAQRHVCAVAVKLHYYMIFHAAYAFKL